MGDKKKIKRLQLALEEEELRSLRIPSTIHRGTLSPSKNAFLPTLQEQTQDHTRNHRGGPGQRRSLGAAMRQGPQSARGSWRSRGSDAEKDEGSSKGVQPKCEVQTLLNRHVLGHISADWLDSVKQDFLARGGTLNLNQFVSVLMACLEQSGGAVASNAEPKKTPTFADGGYPNTATPLPVPDFLADLEQLKSGVSGRAAAVIDLFRRIDVHGEGAITWDEVSNYLIEHGAAGGDHFNIDCIKHYRQSTIVDGSPKHDQPVEKLVYLAQMDVVACLSSKARGFRLYDPASCTVKHEVSGHRGHRGSLVNCCYVSGLNQIATTGADMTVCLWDYSTLGLRNRLTAKDVQLSLCGGCDTLFSGAIDGTLSRWDISNMCLSETRKGQHKDAINDLLMVEDINLLASASSDGSTIVWDLETMRPKKTFKGHRKGTFSLAYSPDYRCLLTSGLEQEALVWNPYVERVPIFRLKGHVNALCGVAVVPGTPQIISADVKGVFRLWDMRNFRCVQAFGGKEARMNHLNTFCALPSHRRIMAGGSSIALFDYCDDLDGESVTEVSGVTDALYNPHMGEFYTFSQGQVKAWSAGTGALFKMMPDISQSEITACKLDENGRKLYVGDSSGRVSAHSINNGAVLSRFESHAKDISCLEAWPGSQKVFSASWDGALKCQIDDRVRKPYTKVEFNHHKDGVTCMACSVPLMLLATGGTDTQVCLYDMKSLKWEHSLNRLQHVIASLDFLESRCLLAVADLGGFVSLWRTRPHPHPDRWTQVYHFSNLPSTPGADGSLLLTRDCGPAASLQSVKFGPAAPRPEGSEEAPPLRLFTADTKGTLRCWDLSAICERRGVVEVNLADLFKGRLPSAPPRPPAAALTAEMPSMNEELPAVAAPPASAAAAPSAMASAAAAGEVEADTPEVVAEAGGGAFMTGVDEERAQPRAKITTVRSAAARLVAAAQPSPTAPKPKATAGPVIERTEARLCMEVQAHEDGIVRLHVIRNPPSLVTCGHDCRVRTWDWELQRFGDLLQNRDPTYNFPYDPLVAQKAKLTEAAELLKTIQPAPLKGAAAAGAKALRLPKMPKPASAEAVPDGILDSLTGGRPPKVDPDEKWRQDVARVISDPDADPADYEQLLAQFGQFGRQAELERTACAAHERLMRNANARQFEHLPQRTKTLSVDEASAAERLARAMSAIGGDDFGCYAAMARRLRPRSMDRVPYSAR